jgi:mannose-1-phosphate guanylyltransferase
MTAPPRGAGGHDWAIVLAAGHGQRLARLIRAMHGRDIPKQFALLDGGPSFFQQTLARAVRLAPSARIVVVASEEHAQLAREQAAGYQGVQVIAQPRNVGTLPGLMLPLAHVLDADPWARAVVYPSDHHVERPPFFYQAVGAALGAIERAPARLVLVGAAADRPATDLGWILAGQQLAADAEGGPRSVERFVEKPDARSAARLLASGALWNTLLLAFDAAAFWDAALAGQPELAEPFQRYRSSVATKNEQAVRAEIYRNLPTLDLSHDLLASRRGLAVVEMKQAGWSDCGTPERLARCLALRRTDWLLGRPVTGVPSSG